MIRPQRYRFLDLYRGFIVLLMLEGHVLRALLRPDFQRSEWFAFHELLHGITGPGFLFGAGFAFAIATQRRWEDLIAVTPAFLRRAWRMVMLIGIGYALHIPYFSLRKMIGESTPAQWDAFASFDVLQCIGLTLLGLRVLLLSLREEKRFLRFVVVLLLAVVYTTPILWEPWLDERLSRGVATALNGLHGSPFPLFPFAGFLLAGTVVSWRFLRRWQEGTEGRFMLTVALTGAGLIAVAYVVDLLPLPTYGAYNFWDTSPNYFWIRLGLLLLILSGMWFLGGPLERVIRAFPAGIGWVGRMARKGGDGIWMPAWLVTIGVESFVVYIAHLFILYGWELNPETNLTVWWGLKLDVGEAVLTFVGLTAVMVLVATLWRSLKRKHPVLMRGIYWYMGGMFLYYFLTNPY